MTQSDDDSRDDDNRDDDSRDDQVQADEQRRIDRLIARGLATRAQIDEALEIGAKIREMGMQERSLGEVLCEKGYLTAEDLEALRREDRRMQGKEQIAGYRLIERLGEEFSDDAMEEAAEYFGVSELTVRSQLVNHHYLSQFALGSDLEGGAYPYQI